MQPTPALFAPVLLESLRAFGRTFFAHLRWNVGFFLVLFLSMCVTTCVAMVPLTAMRVMGGERDTAAPLAAAVVYLAMLALSLVLFALHQGATLAILQGDTEARPVTTTEVFSRAFAGLRAVAPTMLLRGVLDLLALVVPLGAIGAALVAAVPLEELRDPARLPFVVAGGVALYGIGLLYLVGSRGFVGVSGPVAFHEKVGPLRAIARSAELLRGHRLPMIGLRLVVGLGGAMIYGIAYLPMLGVMGLGAAVGDGRAGLAGLAMLLYMPVLYGVMLTLFSFDSLLEGVFYAKLTRPETAGEVARVFE